MGIKKENNINVEDICRGSQYDGMQVLRDVHDLPGHSMRTRDALSVVPQYYTHFNAVYNLDNQPTEVTYYAGTLSEISSVGVKPATTLNNKYFFLFEGRSSKSYYIWFNVDGLGTDPAIASSTGIQVNLVNTDPAIVVAMAIESVLNGTSYCNIWKTIRKNAVLEITAKKLGETTNTADGNTTFVFSTDQEGTQQEVSKLVIDYTTSGDPIFEGQALKDYVFDIYSGKFEYNNVDVSVDLRELGDVTNAFNEVTSVASLATATVITYTVPIGKVFTINEIEFSGDCIGKYTLTVGGSIQSIKRTHFTKYDDEFSLKDYVVTAGQIVLVEVENRSKGNGTFNSNILGRLKDA